MFSNFSYFVYVTKTPYKGDLRKERFTWGHCFRAVHHSRGYNDRSTRWLPTLGPQSGSRDMSSTLVLNLTSSLFSSRPQPMEHCCPHSGWVFPAQLHHSENAIQITDTPRCMSLTWFSVTPNWQDHGDILMKLDLLNCFKGHFDFAPFKDVFVSLRGTQFHLREFKGFRFFI